MPETPAIIWEQTWAPKYDEFVRDGNLADAFSVAQCALGGYFWFLCFGINEDQTIERAFFNSGEARAALVRAAWWRSKLQALLATLADRDPFRSTPAVWQFGVQCELFDELPEIDGSMLNPRKPKPSPIPR